MARVGLARVLLALPISWRAKALVLATAASAVPSAGLALALGRHNALPFVYSAAASLLALGALAQLLRPMSAIAGAAARCAGPKEGEARRPSDEAIAALTDLRRLESELAQLREARGAPGVSGGLTSREELFAAIDLAHRRRERKGAMGLVRFLDFDRLAAFDETAADAALKALAGRLAAAAGRDAALALVDRDAFALWLEDVSGADEAAGKLHALTYALTEEMTAGGIAFTPEITAAAAIFPEDGLDAAVLLTRAAAALPRSGKPGDARVGLYSSQTASEAKESFALQQALRQAMAHDELFMHFQPVVDLAERRVVGAEALLRWRHPEHGLVSPATFIPILEHSGLMEEVGMWALNAACREARAWRESGLSGMKMAVNLSARQLRQGSLLSMVVRTLERHDLDPEALELELTESAALTDQDLTRALLANLRSLGVSVAIDDFGTGYSSLSSLRQLPFSKLKIDREFVTSVHANRDNHAICSALVALARGLDIGILAEGAETLEEVETLRQLGCSLFQGFFFSRPLPAGEFAARIADPDWLALLASPVHREIASLSRRVS